jgi:hypothetical protein
MSTKNRRVATYLPNELSGKFEVFKSERGITGDSQALVLILSEFLGVSHQSEVNSTDLEEKLSVLKSELKSELLVELTKIIESQIDKPLSESLRSSLIDKIGDVKNDSGSQSNTSGIQLDFIKLGEEKEDTAIETEAANGNSQPDIEQVDLLPLESAITLQTNVLAERLGVNRTAISTKKKIALEQDFYSWLKQKDPDGISWEPVGGDLKGYSKGWMPSEDTPSELLSELQKWVATHAGK